MLKKHRRWFIIGICIGCLLTGTGIAYAAGSLIVGFGSSVGVEGKITIVAPEPTLEDITVECPEFTVTYGDTKALTGTMYVYNTSGHPLTLNSASIAMDNTDVGIITLAPIVSGVNDALPSGGVQSITVTITPWSKLVPVGNYSYSGNLEYRW